VCGVHSDWKYANNPPLLVLLEVKLLKKIISR
jgi:hypothetical protein